MDRVASDYARLLLVMRLQVMLSRQSRVENKEMLTYEIYSSLEYRNERNGITKRHALCISHHQLIFQLHLMQFNVIITFKVIKLIHSIFLQI